MVSRGGKPARKLLAVLRNRGPTPAHCFAMLPAPLARVSGK